MALGTYKLCPLKRVAIDTVVSNHEQTQLGFYWKSTCHTFILLYEILRIEKVLFRNQTTRGWKMASQLRRPAHRGLEFGSQHPMLCSLHF